MTSVKGKKNKQCGIAPEEGGPHLEYVILQEKTPLLTPSEQKNVLHVGS